MGCVNPRAKEGLKPIKAILETKELNLIEYNMAEVDNFDAFPVLYLYVPPSQSFPVEVTTFDLVGFTFDGHYFYKERK